MRNGRPRLGFNRYTVKDGVVFIELSQKQVAMIDLADFALITEYRWHAKRNTSTGVFYAAASIYKRPQVKKIWMHRLLMNVENRLILIDHVNGNGLDNRRENLRTATKAQNMANQKRRTRGFKGVHWKASSRRWLAAIRCEGVQYHLGYYDTAEEAARAYDAAARHYHGNFAKTNF